jgi:hypothetical protein
MMSMDGEITEVATPPNKADQFRTLSIWLPDTEDHFELTVFLTELKKAGMKEGDKIKIQIEKAFNVDEFTQQIFKNK